MNEPTVNLHTPDGCDHDWQPVSFRFETQLLDQHGRVMVRQPDIEEGRVYLVCLLCACYTYIDTQFVGFRLEGSMDRAMKFQPSSSEKYVDWPNRETA